VYSCRSVFVMHYNLPPNKCLKEGFIFLALVIPGPKDPKKQMNIFLRPLMKELKEMWQGVDAYDSHLKCRFNLRAAYLWSIHDYLAYDKFAGWCVHGRLNCPVCMDDSDAFRLEHSKKVTLILIKDSFPWVTSSGVTDSHFRKARLLEKGHQSKSS
jgi:hypothetical protein